MKLIIGNNLSDAIIEVDTIIKGKVKGDIQVLSGAKLFLYAELTGDLYLRKHSTVSIYNSIDGTVYNDGGIVEGDKKLLKQLEVLSQ
ncbi:hypothetical protein [Alkalihalobacterium chitinilyticum]|uniref:Polymer-forming cytoskeletal protein n=1 Tax=Alkalihalobacterium chitinilyticum TaxID=2980103 RepID=A0ABT5VGR6_9BACI|nr:hypothetical protein [Alkalihalobacterium chitinilyticum]MDE5414465.1 hypothetical protein [Alkalihalobacterium chitinilyticum]